MTPLVQFKHLGARETVRGGPDRAGPVALVRCDASASLGAGHVSRCLALAEVLSWAGWSVTFVVSPETPSFAPVLSEWPVCTVVVDRAGRLQPAHAANALPDHVDILVVDHYELGKTFEASCRPWARRILALDDAAGRVHDCDFLLDSASTDDRRYAGFVPDHARVLGGPLFALLRRNFLKHRDVSLARRDGRRVKQILLSFGAADPAKLVPVALDALKGLSDDVAVVVAMSSCAPHIEEVRRSTDCRSVQLVLDSQDISDVMVKSDIAIGAVGVTALERAALGLPSIHVGITENQRGVSELLRQAGASLDAGPVDAELGTRLKGHIDALLADPDRRIRMARAASELADGKGPLRVLIALAGDMGNGAPHVRLRLADGTDRDQLLHLQRQPGIRQHARNPAIPGPDEHARWMDRMLRDASTLLMIIEVGGRNAGMIRLDQKDPVDGWRRFEISIAIAPEFQGQGVARTVLSLARKMFPGAALDAEILPSNGASLKLFAQSGYARVSGNLYRNEAQGRRLD